MTVAKVKLWGSVIGAVSWQADKALAAFEYDSAFASSGVQVSPLSMPLSDRIFEFPELAKETYHGLPGFLADSLPDKFGNAIIDAWMVREGRIASDFNPVDRLCYIGSRGMGALEFEPALEKVTSSSRLDIGALVNLASIILSAHKDFKTNVSASVPHQVLEDIIQVSSSAGGARAKALIAWNSQTEEVRSGQISAEPGFTHWLLKFDGVSGNKDREMTSDPKHYGLIEYAYHLLARSAGISMSECRVLSENGRHHFMTKRFDRRDADKVHMQSLCALAHYDFNQTGAYSYEQALQVIRLLGLSVYDLEEQFRRMVFNVVARNQDDHTKNIAFLMDRLGQWRLSPAFDLTYSYKPGGVYTQAHQMSVNGKQDAFDYSDLLACAKSASIRVGRAKGIISEVIAAVEKWTGIANQVGIRKPVATQIRATHRLYLKS